MSSLQPHVSSETHPKFLLGSNLSFSRDSPNLLYHGFPRRAVKSTGIKLARKRGKKAFPFLAVTSLWLCVHSANNPHDRLYLISFPLPLQYFLGGKGKNIFPNTSALTSFVHQTSVQASRQISAFLFLTPEPARSECHIFSFLKRHQKAFSKHLCISIGESGVFDSMACGFVFFFGLLSFLISLLFLLLG